MLRIALVGLFIAVQSFGIIDRMPEGTFKGKGYWKNVEGKKEAYDVTLTFKKNNTVHEVLSHGEDVFFEMTSTMEMGKHGFFAIKQDGNVVGKGYSGSTWCHMEGTDPTHGKWEATVAYVDGKIFRLGSGTFENKFLVWEDALVFSK